MFSLQCQSDPDSILNGTNTNSAAADDRSISSVYAESAAVYPKTGIPLAVCGHVTVDSDPTPNENTTLSSYDKFARYCWICAIFRGSRDLTVSLKCIKVLPDWVVEFIGTILYEPYEWIDLIKILLYTLVNQLKDSPNALISVVGNITVVIKELAIAAAELVGKLLTAVGQALCKLAPSLPAIRPLDIAKTCPELQQLADTIQQTLQPITGLLKCLVLTLLKLTGALTGTGNTEIPVIITQGQTCADGLGAIIGVC